MSKQFWCALHCCSILRRRCFLRGANSMLHFAAFSPLVFMVNTPDKGSTDWREEERSLCCWFAPLSGLGCHFPGLVARPWCSHHCSSLLKVRELLPLRSGFRNGGSAMHQQLPCWLYSSPVPSRLVLYARRTSLIPGFALKTASLFFCVLACHGNPLIPRYRWTGIQVCTHKTERKHLIWKNVSTKRSDKVWYSTFRDVLDFLYIKSKAKCTTPGSFFCNKSLAFCMNVWGKHSLPEVRPMQPSRVSVRSSWKAHWLQI